MLGLRVPTDIRDLDPGRVRRLIDEAEANHLQNAFAGVLMYPAMILGCFVATDLDENHPALCYSLLGAIVVLGLLRGWLPFRFRQLAPDMRSIAMTGFNVIGLVSAALYTALCLFSWHTYGLDQTTLICLLLGGGLGAGSVTGVCMNLRLAYAFLTVTLVAYTRGAGHEPPRKNTR